MGAALLLRAAALAAALGGCSHRGRAAEGGAAAPASTRSATWPGLGLRRGRRLQGIAEGDTLVVLRGDRLISRLVVRFVSASRAAGDTLAAAAMPQVGDVVRFRPGATSGSAAPPAPASSRRRCGRQRDPRAGGGRGRRAAATLPPAPARADRRAPALRESRRGRRLHAAGARSAPRRREPRRAAAGPAGGRARPSHLLQRRRQPDYSTTRVYRLAATAHDRSGRARVTLGRQFSPSLAVVNLFDGVLASYGRERWAPGPSPAPSRNRPATVSPTISWTRAVTSRCAARHRPSSAGR